LTRRRRRRRKLKTNSIQIPQTKANFLHFVAYDDLSNFDGSFTFTLKSTDVLYN